MLNFVYCLDENYNLQLLTSINSLLERTSEKINIFIAHDNPDSLDIDLLNNNEKANINKYYLDLGNQQFPNLEKAHVSKATYFRLFISKILPNNLDFIIYIDADIVCIQDPVEQLNAVISEVKDSNFYLAARTEHLKNDITNDQIDRYEILNLSSIKYFNAGVLVLDYQYWLNEEVEKKLLKILETNYKNIKYWDQDILNIYYDGNYVELNNALNYDFGIYNNDVIEKHQIYKKNIKLLHYNGKGKPWYLENILFDSAEIYQKEFRKLNLFYYHIVFKFNAKKLIKFIKILFQFKFLKLKKPYEFIKLAFKQLIKFKA